MRILVGVSHPKHVHFRKNIINNLIKNGHEVKIVARGKDITLSLLDAYGFDYEVVGTNYKGLFKKAYGLIESDIKVLKIAKIFKPDILIGGSPYLAHVSRLIGKPHISFTDTEHAKLANWLSFPFSDVIMTPSCYTGSIDPKKHVKYNGYEELAYLHPNYFKPDPGVLGELGLGKDEKFIILRFVSWDASHDRGQQGIGFEIKHKYISELEQYGRIFISSESIIEKEFDKFKLRISPEKLHSLLSYAQLYIGDSASMATEAGILGTPSVYVSTPLTSMLGNFIDLEKRGLIYSIIDQKKALDKAVELLNNKDIKNEWNIKKDNLFKDKIDVTKFIVQFIESYPESMNEMKK